MRARSSLLSLVTILALVLGFAGIAAAENPNQTFSGRVILAAKGFPATAKSPSAYVAAIRKLSSSNFYEDKESHTWKIYFAAFLKTKLDDVEYVVKLYELQGKGGQQLLTSFEQYSDERGQQTIISNMKLEKKMVGVNKEILITVESKGRVLASGRFKILGEGEHYSGKVNFSDDDANKGSGDE